MSKLKPCPFCGGEAELCYVTGLGTDSCRGYTLYASCSECSAKSPGLWQEKKPEPSDPIWDDVAEEWNCRPGEIDATNCGVAYCEHYPEGLPVCGKCREESTLSHDKACAELADCEADRVAISQKLSDALDALFASNKQLAVARAEIERLKHCKKCGKFIDIESITCPSCVDNSPVKKRDKLIEQMREALLLFAEGAIHDFHHVCQHRDNCLCLACQKVRVKAALAAERGE